MLAAVFLAAGVTLTSAGQDKPLSSADEAKLVEKVKRQVIEELIDQGLLQKEVELGIERQARKQREAQIKAAAERDRLAQEKAKNVRRVFKGRDHIFGDGEAAISLIEYSDFECPYCKRYHATPRKVVEKYPGKVNRVYRHFPLPFHNPGAQKEAEASECANELGGQPAFWKFIDAIYERTHSNGQGFPVDQLAPLAKEIGLDETAFSACFDSGRYKKRVQEDIDEGQRIGVTGTPATILLVNKTGEVVVKSGAVPFEALDEAVAKLLEKK